MRIATILLLSILPALAQDVSDPPAIFPVSRWSIEGDFLIARLPEARAVAFRRELSTSKDAKNARDMLLELIDAKTAELVDWPIIQTLAGDRVVSENIQEYRFPVEYSRPNVVINPNPVGDQTSEAATFPKPETGGKNAADGSLQKAIRMLAGVPKTFEARSAGVTFSMEPSVSADGKEITVQLAPQHVTFAGNKRVTVESEGSHTVTVEQPEFHTNMTSTNLRFKSGEAKLIGFYKLKDPAGFVEVSVLTLTARKAGDKE